MRISINPTDVGYWNYIKHLSKISIFLDGIELRGVHIADEEQCYVVYDIRNSAGKYMMQDDGFCQVTRRGKVEVRIEK